MAKTLRPKGNKVKSVLPSDLLRDVNDYVPLEPFQYLDKPILIHICRDGTYSFRDVSRKEPIWNGVALPVYSVMTKEEAYDLMILTCSKTGVKNPKLPDGYHYVVPQFSGQVEDLGKVTAMLHHMYGIMMANKAKKGI